MIVSEIFLADLASCDPLGKLNLMGMFSEVYADELPLTLPLYFYVVMFLAEESEIGKRYAVTLRLKMDGKDEPLFENQTVIEVQTRKNQRSQVEMQAIIQMSGTTFNELGRYDFEVTVEGQEAYVKSLYVVKRPT